MKETSLKKRYVIKLLANIINGMINAVMVALIPKALGPVVYGQFVYLQEFFMKTIGFLDMGSSIGFFTKLSARNDRKELILFYFSYSIIVLLLLTGFIFASDFLGGTSFFIPEIPLRFVYFGLFFGVLTWFTQVFIKVSDAYALTVSVELVKIGHKIVSILLLLFFIYQMPFNLELLYLYHYIALVSFLLILLWLFTNRGIFVNLFRIQYSFASLAKEFISYCHPLVVYSIVGLLAGLFDIWLLQKVAGSKQVGFYGLAYSLAAMCFLFTSAMTPIITREFSKSYENKDLEQMKKLFNRYIPMLYSIAAYFAVFISMQSENVLMIFTDEKFKGTYLVLVIMAFYPIHQTYGQLSGSIFYATGQTKLMRNIALFTQTLGMLFTVIFIYLLGLKAEGLAYKMIVIQLVGVNIQLYFNARLLNLNLKYFLYHQVGAVLFFIIMAYISSVFVTGFSPLLNFFVSGAIYTVLVMVAGYAFPQVFATTREEIKLNFKRVFGK